MDWRMTKAAAEQVGRFAANLVRARLLGRQAIWPFFALYYATHRCNAGCAWCSRSREVRTPRRLAEMNLRRTRQVLASVREIVPTLYVTGGEPLVLDDIEARLEIARSLGFYPILLNTNATLLHRRSDVLRLLDTLVVSLHTVDPAALAATYGVSRQSAVQALDNIKMAAERSASGGAQMMANCVLTPDNIGGANAVLDFCLAHGIELAVVPAVVHQQPLMASGDPAARLKYTQFLDRVVAIKRLHPEKIQGTMGYLWRIRDLQPFPCRPDGMLPISPDGWVINPCDADYSRRGIVDGRTSVRTILNSRVDWSAPFRQCAGKCLKACYVQPAEVLGNCPPAILAEYLARMRR
ncbi:MAG: hypothetical protein UY92_C0010G0034 [Candidatus Magasanikbacteria bacterium GW2011_GWA2_56_11]|uniref:Radical SAM core domain-containing protein n=1 Tax=Candidatus Magasanikbacteria bacterium GW2011_GWA2_56_11 TaxID=1619044 RepID=A0A0G1YFB6_9BACT|nr:MAG: hypothetical protein UY92_C0010G0034 [Candidatus Magasanikbacteria bacterium GW2011_GWA2_56_11]